VPYALPNKMKIINLRWP